MNSAIKNWMTLLDKLFPDTVPEVYCRACGWHGQKGQAYQGIWCPACKSYVTDYKEEQ